MRSLRALGLRLCCGYGALQFFVQVFLRVWIDGDVFSWKVTARLAPGGIAISARKSRKCEPTLIGLGLYGIVVAAVILTLVSSAAGIRHRQRAIPLAFPF
jgi:hypothetical protein